MAGELIAGIGGDGSGFEAARKAASVAQMMRVPLVLVFGFEASALGGARGTLREEIASIGEEAIAEIKGELNSTHPELDIQVEMVQARPVDALIMVAKDRDAVAIAVGHGGNGPLRAALLGSITYEIVHRSPLPVLVVPDDEEDLE